MNATNNPIIPHNTFTVDSIYSFYTRAFSNDFRFDGERHNFWEIVYIINGETGITSEERLYECEAGDLVIHQPNDFHTSWNLHKSDMKLFLITFNGQGLTDILFHGKVRLNDEEYKLIQSMIAETQSCCAETNGEFYYNAPEYEFLKHGRNFHGLKNYLEILCMKLAKYKNDPNVLLTPDNEHIQKYREVVLYLNNNVCKNLAIEDVAAALFASPSYLKKLFRLYANCGIITYYNNIRVDYAIKLINEGKSMNEIASAMNFSSQNYFSYFFKKHTGIPPSEYKKKL